MSMLFVPDHVHKRLLKLTNCEVPIIKSCGFFVHLSLHCDADVLRKVGWWGARNCEESQNRDDSY